MKEQGYLGYNQISRDFETMSDAIKFIESKLLTVWREGDRITSNITIQKICTTEIKIPHNEIMSQKEYILSQNHVPFPFPFNESFTSEEESIIERLSVKE